jgi:hypothetical protein
MQNVSNFLWAYAKLDVENHELFEAGALVYEEEDSLPIGDRGVEREGKA